MVKKAVANLLLVCFVAVMFLGMLSVFIAGRRHVGTVESNSVLEKQNVELKEQNDSLKSVEATPTSQKDLLLEQIQQKDSVIHEMQHEIEAIKSQLENEKHNSVTSSYNTAPYELEPVELSGPEDN